MPAPAVYVIAIVGTVGVAIAFKEFVYEPHIAPRIDRWKAEFQAVRKRKAEAERNAVLAEVALIQRGSGKERHINPEQDNHDSSDNESDSDHQHRKGTSTLRAPVRPRMTNGLLTRRRLDHSKTTARKPADIELDDWITGTSTATVTASQESDLQSTNNNGSLNESIQPLSASPMPPSIRTGGKNIQHTKTDHMLEPKTTETHTFLDESIQVIPFAPITPIRTPTPTHVLYNPSSVSSPSISCPTKNTLPLPEEAPLLKLETNIADSLAFHPPLAPFQPSSSSPSDTATSSSNKTGSLPRPPGLRNTSTLLRVNDETATNSPHSQPFIPLSSQPTRTTFPPPFQLLSPHTSPYQTPHVHPIPSLSQSYPPEDLLDYEHGLELLSPPSPLSRTDSPFELAGLSPRPRMAETSTLLSTRSGGQLSVVPADNVTNSARSTTYLSFPSSPALSASSISASSENGYENDSSRSEISSTFSSPVIAASRLTLGLDPASESLSPHGQARSSSSISPFSSRSSSSSIDYSHSRGQQQEWSIRSTTRTSTPPSATRSQHLNSQQPIITPSEDEYDDYADAQTLSPRNRTESPWAMMDRSPEVRHIEPTVRMSRATMSNSDFETGSELSDIDILGTLAEEYVAATIGSRGNDSSGGRRSSPGVHTGAGSGSGLAGRAGGNRGPRIGGGNESDTSSWSLAGGSE